MTRLAAAPCQPLRRHGIWMRKSEKGVFGQGHQKAGTAGFAPHTMVNAPRLGVDEISGM